MQLLVTPGSAWEINTPLLGLLLYEGDPVPEPIQPLFEAGDFTAAARQSLLLYPQTAIAARRLMLIGLGKRDGASTDGLRGAAALLVQRARELRLDSCAVVLPASSYGSATTAQLLSEGALLGSYRYLRFRTNLSEADQHTVTALHLLGANDADAVQSGSRTGAAIARGVILARDLANGPGNLVTPGLLAETAQQLAQEYGLRATIFGLPELREQGFGGLLAVAQGSAQEPRFIILEHRQASPDYPTICLVGKGITFDTGGISIKPAEKMDDMKMDMGGAAAVLGTLQVVAELNLPLHVVGLISAAENMPSSTAYKPGDIVTTLSGKTVEVLNTDAEGRIVLADALHYATRYEARATIDLATLTGAIMVALGPHASGLMCNDDQLAERLLLAGEHSGERVWRMPLWNEYREMIKSEIADVKNSSGRYGGAPAAAAFLSTFAGERPWAHLDIAGTAWVENASKPYQSKGATGVGVRLLAELLRHWS